MVVALALVMLPRLLVSFGTIYCDYNIIAATGTIVGHLVGHFILVYNFCYAYLSLSFIYKVLVLTLSCWEEC